MTWTGLTLYNNDGLQSFAIQFPRNVKRLGRLRCAELCRIIIIFRHKLYKNFSGIVEGDSD